jgi:hypothetical protein
MHTRNIFSHKSIAIASLSIGSLIQSTFAEEPVADMVILDEISTRNLGIEAVEADVSNRFLRVKASLAVEYQVA